MAANDAQPDRVSRTILLASAGITKANANHRSHRWLKTTMSMPRLTAKRKASVKMRVRALQCATSGSTKAVSSSAVNSTRYFCSRSPFIPHSNPCASFRVRSYRTTNSKLQILNETRVEVQMSRATFSQLLHPTCDTFPRKDKERRSLTPPKLLRSETCALGHRLKFCPGDLRMTDPRADAAVRAGNDIFFPHQSGKIHEPIRNCLRMFNEVTIVSGNPRNQYLVIQKFDLPPNPPLMLMARIVRLDGISPGANFEN